jgi:hypothetical protein
MPALLLYSSLNSFVIALNVANELARVCDCAIPAPFLCRRGKRQLKQYRQYGQTKKVKGREVEVFGFRCFQQSYFRRQFFRTTYEQIENSRIPRHNAVAFGGGRMSMSLLLHELA